MTGKFAGLVVGAEFDEQVEHHRMDIADAGVRPVDLVDDDDRLEAGGERLLEHEPRLRERPFRGIHQHERAVGHLQDALDLAAEVGVPRRVDEVHLHVADADAAVLRENRDAALALLVVGVHDQAVLPADEFVQLLGPELPGLPEHLIDECRLAVVDVGNDGDVANIVPLHGSGSQSTSVWRNQTLPVM